MEHMHEHSHWTLNGNRYKSYNSHDRNTTRQPKANQYSLSLTHSLIEKLPAHVLRDSLHSVAHLALVQEALFAAKLPPTTKSKRKKRSPFLQSDPQHCPPSHTLRHDLRPPKRDLAAASPTISSPEPLTPESQQLRRHLLILIHRVNVYYSNTFNTADAVMCLLNIAHRALDRQSIPIRSATPTEFERDQMVSRSASIRISSQTPRTMDSNVPFLPRHSEEIIPIADDVLSSLTMILIQYPRSQHLTSLTTSQSSTPIGEWATEDGCDLTDGLLEMVYALLDHEHYCQRPLTHRLSEFLIQIALRRERKFLGLELKHYGDS